MSEPEVSRSETEKARLLERSGFFMELIGDR